MALSFVVAAACVAAFSVVATVEAASVASSGANDKARCVGGAIGSSGTPRLNNAAFMCHFDVAAATSYVTAQAGTTATITNQTVSGLQSATTGNPAWPGVNMVHLSGGLGYDPADPGCGTSTAGTVTNPIKIYYGPQTVSGVTIPANAFAVECTGSAWWPSGTVGPTLTAQAVATWPNALNAGTYGFAIACNSSVGASCSAANAEFKITAMQWIATSVNFADFLDNAETANAPTNWFPGGGDFTQVLPFCGAGIAVTGSSTVVANQSYASSVAGQNPQSPASQVEVTVTPLYSTTGNVDILFFPEAADRNLSGYTTAEKAYHRVYTDVGAGPVVPFAVTVPVSGTGVIKTHALGTARLRCWDKILSQYFYAEVANTTTLVASNATLSPCKVAEFGWPTPRDMSVGDTATWSLDYAESLIPAGTDNDIYSIQWAAIDRDAVGPVPSFASLSWTTITTTSPTSTAPYTSSAEHHWTTSVAAPYDGPIAQFVFRCQDVRGFHYDAQWITGVRTAVGTVEDTSEGGCYAQAGIGLSPSSWVPGAARMGACILRALFIPSDESLSAITSAGAASLEHAPFSYVAESIEIVVVGYGALVDAVDDSGSTCFVGVGGTPGGGTDDSPLAETEVCASDFPSGFTMMRSFLVWLFWLGFCWMILKDSLDVFTT